MTSSLDAERDVATDDLDLGEVGGVREGFEGEREHRKRQLALALRLFAKYGYDEGIAGHMTARDPEFPDRFWVNPFAVHFSRVKVSDLLLIDHEGRLLEGSRRTNKAAFWIHAEIHKSRPDAVAIAHAHSIHGRAWASLGRPLDPIVQESCAFFQDHSVFQQYGGLVLEQDEAARIAQSLGRDRAIILRHHGLLTLGRSVEEAAWWFIAMDRACQMQLLAEAAGQPQHMPPDEARLAHRQFGNSNMARHNFRQLAELILEDEPDVVT